MLSDHLFLHTPFEARNVVLATMRFPPLRMRVCIVGAIARLTALTDTSSIQPRLNIATFPHPSSGMVSLPLRPVIFAFRVLRPIQRETVTDEPISEVGTINRTRRNGPTILIQIYRRAINCSLCNESIKIVRRLCSASILKAIVSPAKLAAFRSINPRETNTRSVQFERVAVDH